MPTFKDYTQAASLTDLDTMLTDHTHELHRLKMQEQELVAKLIATRQAVKSTQDYLGDLTDYINKYLQSSTDMEKRSKIVRAFRDRYLKKYQVIDYKNVVKFREYAEQAKEAKAFALKDDFNPDSIRGRSMRGTLETVLVQSTDLPKSPELDALQHEIRNVLVAYAPRNAEQQKAADESKKKIEASFESQIQAITMGVMEKMGLKNDDKGNVLVVDMPGDPKPA